MLLRERYILRNVFAFFFILLVAVTIFLLIVQAFWGIIDARHTGLFNYKEWIINVYDSLQILLPFLTILSSLFVFSEMEKFRQISILQLKGISELQIFRTFLFFGLLSSVISFFIGCFPPYPNEQKGTDKVVHSIDFTTNEMFLWIKHYDNGVGEDVIFKMNNKEAVFTCYAKKAEFLEGTIIFYDGLMSYFDGQKKYFDSFVLNVNFNPLFLTQYLTFPIERQSFFRLYPILKSVSNTGIKSKTEWITLFSKISYPSLNFFIIMLLLPFFLRRKFLTRAKIFIIALVLTLLTYSLYSAGLSLGKAEIIPWQISPWLSHFVLLIVFIGWLFGIHR